VGGLLGLSPRCSLGLIASKRTALTGLDEDRRDLTCDAALRTAEALARRIHLASRAQVKRRFG
jgi:hypothetical protein